MPVVAIVGRPNVGKSSLLNALAGKLISIVQDMPGVTRDRISFPLPLPISDKPDAPQRYVELLDTGGYGFNDPTGLTEHIRHQIDLAIARADLVLFIVDCQAGLTTADETIAQLLRQRGLKVVLLANKADGEKADLALTDFARLGFGTPVGVSALNHRNLDDVFIAIRRNVDLKNAPSEIPEPEMLVAIVGKRNAGKSTLVNAIARIYEGEESERVIVSEVPGTTRDSVDVRFDKDGQTLVVIDTAGVRKRRHMVGGKSDIEFYAFHRAERSIRRANVVMLLIDATEPVSEVDKKLAAYVAEQFKPVVLVINKWDLAKAEFLRQAREQGVDPDDHAIMAQYKDYLDKTLRHIDYAPIAFVTAKEGKNVQQVLDLARHLHKQSCERVGTGRLNAAIEQIFGERTPSHYSGKRPRVYYATQTGTNPPEIVLFVNNPTLITETYQRFMINRFRELLPYAEVPIKLAIRGKVGAVNPNKPRPEGPTYESNKGLGKRGNTRGHARPQRTEPLPTKPVWDGNELLKSNRPSKPPKPGKPLPKQRPSAQKPRHPKSRRSGR
jgi:GTP-binding protein